MRVARARPSTPAPRRPQGARVGRDDPAPAWSRCAGCGRTAQQDRDAQAVPAAGDAAAVHGQLSIQDASPGRRLDSRGARNPTLIDQILATLATEFAPPDVEQATRMVVRTAVALFIGAAIGWDRERREADAGLRTHMLVALGAAIFAMAPLELGFDDDALSRVVQGVVSGIGFIGAGAVLKNADKGVIHGLTTAASIWVTAALGVAAGTGREFLALFGTLLVLVVLTLLRRLRKYLHDATSVQR
jgi:putative Mg2+ transporter-C (MgtC) family protein